MALADYFARNAVAASQVLKGFDEAALRERLEDAPIALGFTRTASRSLEGRALLDLGVRLLARLYPVLVLRPGSGADGVASDLAALAREINPCIELREAVKAPVGIAVGDPVGPVADLTVFAGSDGWDAHVSTNQACAVGSSYNPIGAGVAASLAAANVFRAVFLGGEAARMDHNVWISAWDLDAGRSSAAPELTSMRVDSDVVVVGLGAIGNSAIWALGRTPVQARLRLVDPEVVDLGNMQRYVLTRRSDEGRPKVVLAGEALAQGQEAELHLGDWAQFVEAHGYTWDRVMVGLDSARDRRAVQATLPRWIANGWTQPGDLGVSTHDFRGGACLACLYLPHTAEQSDDAVIAAALGIPDRLMDARTLLYRNAPVPREMLDLVATRLGLPVEVVVPFEGRSLRELYVEGICGGAVLPIGQAGSPRRDVHVPMAHQSAMAGVLLTAALIRNALGRSPKGTRVTRINLMRAVGSYLSQPAQKDAKGRCICQDPDFQTAYDRKYSRRRAR